MKHVANTSGAFALTAQLACEVVIVARAGPTSEDAVQGACYQG